MSNLDGKDQAKPNTQAISVLSSHVCSGSQPEVVVGYERRWSYGLKETAGDRAEHYIGNLHAWETGGGNQVWYLAHGCRIDLFLSHEQTIEHSKYSARTWLNVQ
jgi:hypothetical protein